MEDLNQRLAGQQGESHKTAQQPREPAAVATVSVARERQSSSKILPWVATDLVAYGPFSKLPRPVAPVQSAQVMAQVIPAPELDVYSPEHTNRQIDSFLHTLKHTTNPT